MASIPQTEPVQKLLQAWVPKSLFDAVRIAAIEIDSDIKSIVRESLTAWLSEHERRRNRSAA